MENQFATIEKLLKDDHCIIHINPAYPGTILPDVLKKNPNVTLKISYHFAGALHVNEQEIVAVLLFNNSPFTCTIPMHAVWGVTSEYGVHTTWDEYAPHPMMPLTLKKNQKEQKVPTPISTKAVKKEKEKVSKKERPDFLKRVK